MASKFEINNKKLFYAAIVLYVVTVVVLGEVYNCINKSSDNFYVIKEILDGRQREALSEKQIAVVHQRDRIADLKNREAKIMEKAHLRIRHLKLLLEALTTPGVSIPRPELVSDEVYTSGMSGAQEDTAYKLAATLRHYTLRLETSNFILTVHSRMRYRVGGTSCLGGTLEINERGAKEVIVDELDLCEIAANAPEPPNPKDLLAKLAQEIQRTDNAAAVESRKIQSEIAEIEERNLKSTGEHADSRGLLLLQSYYSSNSWLW